MRTNSRLRLTRHFPALFAIVSFSWLGFGISPANAQDLFWTQPLPESGVPANDGNWFTPDNWSSFPPQQVSQGTPGPPTPAQSASVGNAPPATIASAGPTAPGVAAPAAAVANQLLIGGRIEETDDTPGLVATGTGQVIVNGATASLQVFGTPPLTPGSQLSLDVVSGSVLVENGATLTSNGSGVGRIGGAATAPTVTVTGSGSTWTENGTLTIGVASDSAVIISDGASFRAAGTVTIGLFGTLNIGTGGLAGIFNAPSIVNGGGIDFDFTDTTTLSAPVSGTGVIDKFGSGTLTLTGNNSYSGGTFIEDGTVVAAATNALGIGPVSVSGPTSLLRINQGTLQSSFFTVSGGGTLDNAGTLQPPVVTDEFTALITVNAGTITNEVTGSINAGPGLIAIQAAPAEPTDTTDEVAALAPVAPVTVTNAGAISGNIAISIAGVDTTITNASTGVITGTSGTAIEASGGTVTLANAGVIHGNVTLDDFPNTVTLFTASQITGNLNLGSPTAASLILDGSGTQLLSQAVTGTVTNFSSLTKQGGGTWKIDETLTYAGGTTITGGTLQIGNGGTTGSITGNVNDNGTLVFDRSDSVTFGGKISGAGVVSQNGTGTTTLTGINTYSGGTNLNNGILAAGSDANLGTGALSFNGGTLEALSAGGGIVSSKAITLNGAGGTFLADAGTVSTLTGAITGPGAWTKTGTGALTLSGANTYTGATTVSAGVLQAGSQSAFSARSAFTINTGAVLDLKGFDNVVGSLSGSGLVSNTGGAGVFSNATLSVGADNTSTTFSGTLQDGISTLALTKVGAGTLILTGINTYTGTTTVDAGSLIVDGKIASSQTLVNAGGFLGGRGSLSGALVNSGIVSPGDSPGTLTVGGNYTQSAAGTLRIEIAGIQPSQHDLLAVNGHASLAGTLQLIGLGSFKLHVGDQLTFLTATAGVSGSFGTVQNELSTNSFLVKAQVVNLPNAVLLEGTQGSFESVACTPNSAAVAKALDNSAGDPRASTLIAFLNDQLINKLCGDFTLIAPEELASIFDIGVSLANVQTANLKRRMEDIRAGSTGFSAAGFNLNGGALSLESGFAGVIGPEGKGGPPVMAPTPENRWGVWVTGIGEFTNIDSTNAAAGYDLQTGGLTLGVDYRFSPNFAVGLTGGYAHTNANLVEGGNLDVNGGKFGLYATAFASGFYLDTAVTGGFSGYNSQRTALLGSASGNTEGGELNVLVAGGYDWVKGGLSVGPTANFQYTYVGFSGFTETGSIAPLNIAGQNAESERTAFGLKASYDWKVGHVVIKPEVSVGWQHEYGDQSYAIVASFANGAGNSFTVNSPQIGRDSLLIGAGAAVLLNERVSVYAYYDGELLRTNYESNNVSAGVRVTF